MSGLYEILPKIKDKPGMYIGKPALNDLFMFLVGYKTARRELGIEPSQEEMEFHREFQPWLQKRFEVQTVNSWATIIRFYTHDEKEAFNYFFKLLDEFLKRDKSEEKEELSLTKSNNHREQGVGSRECDRSGRMQ
ncbi:hypothetical protein BJP36_24110 [Moorena producens JHB]|uniref:Uncharacterized protein n=1 Tax=Moorena producens (strain JHB) TaxID=1454205 RepID=A0A1D9G4J3_MOOP1|nr:hypothetical protein [Moorena producens]AOY82538.1 hypothetical protein BJP36_24110 [Moorena producens JHB]